MAKSDWLGAMSRYDGNPKDEFEWELFLRASDRRGAKLGELMEKYLDDPDRERIIAREMGWTHIEEMLDAEANPRDQEQPDNIWDDDFDESEPIDIEGERPCHPLVTRLIERSVALAKLAGQRRDKDLEEMVGAFMTVGPKVGGSLGIVRPNRQIDRELKGLVVARLKRALGELSRALNAASRLKEKKLQLPFSIDEWIAEMLSARQGILALMNEFRR